MDNDFFAVLKLVYLADRKLRLVKAECKLMTMRVAAKDSSEHHISVTYYQCSLQYSRIYVPGWSLFLQSCMRRDVSSALF